MRASLQTPIRETAAGRLQSAPPAPHAENCGWPRTHLVETPAPTPLIGLDFSAEMPAFPSVSRGERFSSTKAHLITCLRPDTSRVNMRLSSKVCGCFSVRSLLKTQNATLSFPYSWGGKRKKHHFRGFSHMQRMEENLQVTSVFPVFPPPRRISRVGQNRTAHGSDPIKCTTVWIVNVLKKGQERWIHEENGEWRQNFTFQSRWGVLKNVFHQNYKKLLQKNIVIRLVLLLAAVTL